MLRVKVSLGSYVPYRGLAAATTLQPKQACDWSFQAQSSAKGTTWKEDNRQNTRTPLAGICTGVTSGLMTACMGLLPTPPQGRTQVQMPAGCYGVLGGAVTSIQYLQRAFRLVWMPALAIVTVCCSITWRDNAARVSHP